MCFFFHNIKTYASHIKSYTTYYSTCYKLHILYGLFSLNLNLFFFHSNRFGCNLVFVAFTFHPWKLVNPLVTGREELNSNVRIRNYAARDKLLMNPPWNKIVRLIYYLGVMGSGWGYWPKMLPQFVPTSISPSNELELEIKVCFFFRKN